MNKTILILAASAMLPLAACGSKKNSSAGTNVPASAPVTPVKAPADGDWSSVAVATTAGGFLMGNPDAKVKLVEIGALTCPHCREFDETAVEPLIQKYVKTGQVSWEFRPYLLSGVDIPANLIVACNGATSFFPLMRALYKDQSDWLGKLRAVPAEQLEQVQAMPPQQQFAELSKIMGLQQWAALRGVPRAKSDQCLKDQKRADQLVQQTGDVSAQYADFKGTPSFILNGELLDVAGTWPMVEPEIQKALK